MIRCPFQVPERAQGTEISLPFRSEVAGDEDFLKKLQRAVDPLVLLGPSEPFGGCFSKL